MRQLFTVISRRPRPLAAHWRCAVTKPPAWTPGLSGRSQLCRSPCLPYRAVHYYNSARHTTADKTTCIAAIYQTGLESMQATSTAPFPAHVRNVRM